MPAEGVIPTIEAADTHHLVFAEPDNYTIRHGKGFDLIGPMDYRRLVYNFHVYCGQRSPVTGDPVDLHTCVDHEVAAIVQRMKDRAHKATPDQPGGPAWFMSEFGATHSLALVSAVTAYAEYFDLGWAYWSWKYYDDPTGSSFEALVNHRGRLEATVDALSRTYPQAVAGTPTSVRFDPVGGDFSFTYTPAPPGPRADGGLRGRPPLPPRLLHRGDRRPGAVGPRQHPPAGARRPRRPLGAGERRARALRRG